MSLSLTGLAFTPSLCLPPWEVRLFYLFFYFARPLLFFIVFCLTSSIVLAAVALTCPYFPPELLSAIFRLVCSEHDPTLRVFRLACYRLSHVCQYWRVVACAEPYLWRTLMVDESTSPEYLDAFLHYSRQRPIAVAFAVFREYFPAPIDICESLIASATRLLPSLPRWAALELYIDDKYIMDQLTAFFTKQRVPHLRFLSITCRASDLDPKARLFCPGPLLFGGNLRRLEHVALYGVALPWALILPMPLIVDLTLDGIAMSSWPTYSMFVRLITHSSSLRRICLSGVGFSGNLPSSPILVDHVIHLDLSFGFGTLNSERTLFLMLSVVHFTHLECLGLSFIDTAAVSAFLTTSLAFRSHRVCLEGVCSDVDCARSIYARLSGVHSLDLRRGHPAMVTALKPCGLPPGAFPLSALICLILYKPDWRALLDVLRCRASFGATRFGLLQCSLPITHSRLTYAVPHVAQSELPDYLDVLRLIGAFEWLSLPLPENPLTISLYSL